jgi:hypothetical protein
MASMVRLTRALRDELVRIRTEVRRCERVRTGACGIVSEEVFVQYGWPIDCGTVTLRDGTVVDDHCWNILPGGGILDVTHDQFAPNERLLPTDILVLSSTHPDRWRYVGAGG